MCVSQRRGVPQTRKVCRMSNGASEFGKDLGLVHEMVVTGRKAGATREMYSLFASNQEWFARIAKLCHHLEVIDRLKIELSPISAKEAEDLISWVVRIIGPDCFLCGGIGFEKRLVLHLFIPEEVLKQNEDKIAGLQNEKEIERERYDQLKSYDHAFFKRMTEELRGVGLHPAELVAFGLFALNEDGSLNSSRDCFDARDFIRTIHQIVARRNLLVQLKAQL